MTSSLNPLKRYNFICIIFALLFAAALIIREVDGPTEEWNCFLSSLLTFIMELLVIWWGVLAYNRIINRYIRNWTVVICVLLAVFILMRYLKYNIFEIYTDAHRITWYMYYIPLLLITVSSIYAVSYINRDGSKGDGGSKPVFILFVVAIILITAVLTNDFHQLVFIFPDDGSVYSDKNYARGFLFYVISAWYLICCIIFIWMIIKRCKIPGKNKYIWIPSVILIFTYIYHILYISGVLHHFFGDMIIWTAFFTILIFESLIKTGIIRSNMFYADIFEQSSIPAAILDNDKNIIFMNTDEKICDDNMIDILREKNVIVDGNIRLNMFRLSKGYIIWKDNISKLVSIKKKLDSSRNYLEGKYVAESNMQNTNIVRRRLRERNLMYDEMRRYTLHKIQQIRHLTEEFKTASKEDEWKYLLLMGTLSIYVKRMDNLIFIEKENSMIPPDEIQNCISESERHLNVFGIFFRSSIQLNGNLSIAKTARLYDDITEILENTERFKPSYFLSLTEEQDTYELRVRISGISDCLTLFPKGYKIEQEDIDEYIIKISYDKEDGIV